jgi:hypothetical protein
VSSQPRSITRIPGGATGPEVIETAVSLALGDLTHRRRDLDGTAPLARLRQAVVARRG